MNVESLLRKPYGAAEQNMYNFAYSLYNLKYLKATNQLTQTKLKETLGEMNLRTYARLTGFCYVLVKPIFVCRRTDR